MNVRDAIRRQLADVGADGLVNADGDCGCSITDLMPCGNSVDVLEECEPSRAQTCPACGERFFTACGRRLK